jgi:large repetitive protein
MTIVNYNQAPKEQYCCKNSSYYLVRWLIALFVFTFTEGGYAQSLQWSQYNSPNPLGGSRVLGRTLIVKKAADGSIFTVGYGQTGVTTPPTFPTSNVAHYGNFIASTNDDNTFTYLCKYTADGSTLQWVRVLGAQNPAATTSIQPQDMEIMPNGDVVLLVVNSNGMVSSNAITGNALVPTPPTFSSNPTARRNRALTIHKFSTSGNLLYGSYLPIEGSSITCDWTITDKLSPESLAVGSDGTIHVMIGTSEEASTVQGNFTTTSGALATSLKDAPIRSGSKRGTVFMIFNPDNTLRYSTYLVSKDNSLNPTDLVVAPNGDLYASFQLNHHQGMAGAAAAPYAEPAIGVAMPANAAQPNFTTFGYILRFNALGQVIGGTYIPSCTNNTTDVPIDLAIRPNGNIVGVSLTGDVYEFNSSLTTELNHFNPFGFDIDFTPNASGNRIVRDIDLDDAGRIHFVGKTDDNVPLPTTPAALEAATDTEASYYGIIDINSKKLIYGTQISHNLGAGQGILRSTLYTIYVDGCTAYTAGVAFNGLQLPVTPTAYDATGTVTVSGYDITPSGTTNSGSDGFLMAFNYPVQKPSTNVLTAPAITNFCKGSGILPIEGSKPEFFTPSIIGKADVNPAPTPTYYQWQVSSSPSGPWTDMDSSNTRNYVPKLPATAGMYYYRRLVRQTPFLQGATVPTCDESDISNIISFTYSNNNSHATNIPEQKYGICKDGAALALTYNVTQSVDGAFAPYTYKLTGMIDLDSTVMGQSGTLAAVGNPINLSITIAGDYILQVKDSRGCISFDTLKVENLNLNAGPDVKYTCAEATVKLGPISLPPDYFNYPTNTFTWSPAAGLNNPTAAAPVFTHGLAVGDSTIKYLTFNGCLVDSIQIINATVTTLSALPDIALCQGDTATLGSASPTLTGVTYEWAPGLGLTSTSIRRPIFTASSAPQGVNERIYTLVVSTGNTGCQQQVTQKTTVFRFPNQSFNLKQILANRCNPTKTLQFPEFGNPSEPGISYSWTATVVDDPANVNNTGLPTNTQVLLWLSDSTASRVSVNSKTPGQGYAQNDYKIIYVRRSYNTANPSCFRTDTAELYYFTCSSGNGGNSLACNLALGAIPTISCGGPNNKIGPQSRAAGTYTWSRKDGQPLNNELFEVGSNLPLSNSVPHPIQVIANPSGLVAVDYRLTFVAAGATGQSTDTCVIDIRVFPAAVGKPNVNYPDNQALCQGNAYTVQGSSGNPALIYAWTPAAAFVDSTLALPTLKVATAYEPSYITVTDPSTGCFSKDTVNFVMTPVDVNAGADATFCNAGATVDIGVGGKAGYTYQWTSPTIGVTFGNATSAQTTATLPATPTDQTILLILTATNTLTPANCSRPDTVIYTAKAAPTVTIPTTSALCTGGSITIGPITPAGASNTYAWAGPSIVSGQGTTSIVANATGSYTVTVTQGTCTATATRTITAATNPTVNLAPAAACASDVVIGASTMTAVQKAGWSFSWDKFDAMTSSAVDLSSLNVRPTTNTTYTLTARHVSGCSQTFPIVVPAAAYSANMPSTLNLCEGDNTALPLNAPSIGGATVAWTATPSTATAYLSSTTATNPTINMTTAIAGSYQYTATVSYPTGCVSRATIKVNIGKKREGVAGLDRTTCSGSTRVIGSSTSISGLSYEWSSTPLDPTLTAINTANPSVSPTVNTTYKVRYTDVSGCYFEDDVFVKVNPALDLAVNNLTVCQNAAGNATVNLATAITSNTGTSTSYWANSRTTVAVINPVDEGGTYYIRSVNADSTCTVVKPISVSFSDTPLDNFICPGESYIMTATANMATYQWQRDSSGTFVNIAGATTMTYIARTIGIYRYVATDTSGCAAASCCPIEVKMNNNCPCDTTLTVRDTAICAGTIINLFDMASGVKGTLTYSTNGITWMALTNPTNVNPAVTTTYYIKDSLNTGCKYIRALNVEVTPTPTTPSLTSPVLNNCPVTTVNLTTMAAALTPSVSGSVFEWRVGNSPTSSLVGSSNAVGAGTYYLFEKSPTNCVSTGAVVTVQILTCCPPVICIPVTVTRN